MATLSYPLVTPAPTPAVSNKITNHVERAIEKLPLNMRQPNIEKFLSALVRPFQEIEDTLCDLLLNRSLDTAEGVQLDLLGAIVGQPRNGLSDADYPRFIKARIKVNRSSGTVDELLAIARLLVDDTDMGLVLTQYPPGAITVEATKEALTSALGEEIGKFLRDAAGAGVNLHFQYSEDVEAEMFAFGESTFADGSISIAATAIDGDDFSRWPAEGDVIVDEGLSAEETISFSGRSSTQLIGVTGVANNHLDRAVLRLDDTSGKGFDDFDLPGSGGKLASVTDGFDDPVAVLTASQRLGVVVGLSEPSYFWGGVVTGGGSVGHNLTLQGTATEGNATTGLVADNIISQVAFNFPNNDADAGADASDNTVGDAGSSHLHVFLMKGPTTNPASTLSLGGKREKSGVFAGYEISAVPSAGQGRIRVTLDVGASAPTAEATGDHYDDNWHAVAVLIDQNAGQFSIATDLATQVNTAFTSDSESNTEVFTIGEHRLNSAESEIAFWAIFEGAEVEGVNLDAIVSAVMAEMVV